MSRTILSLFPVLCLSVFVFVLLTTVVVQRNKNHTPSYPLRWFYQNSSEERVIGEKFSQPKTTILVWTNFFGEKDYLPQPSSEKFVDCPFDNCMVTSDRNMLNQSGMVVFHWADIDSTKYPRHRSPDQYWVMLILESPVYTADFSQYDNIMNMTASYRLDSDIFAPYINIRMKTSFEELSYKGHNYATNKTKMIAWFVSNCGTSSNREGYVNELKKYIDVDVYGQCGTHHCHPKMSFECYNNIAKDYYFYLSFENSICKDYVTEKYFHILQTEPGIVPIVMSGGDFKRIGPPGAYINALDFDSPSALAYYLKKLVAQPALYNEYFEWRRRYTLGGHHWVCDACRLLNQRNRKKRVVTDFHKWWVKDARCRTWLDGMIVDLDKEP